MVASANGIVFTIDRVFNAPRERVWRAWTEASQLRKWWGPKGCTLEVGRFEFRPGGFFHYAMNFPGVPPIWGRFNYREITAPERIVWLNSFANERCGIARAPFSEVCPLEIENTVTFAPQGNATKVSLHAEPFGELPAERKFFEDLQPSMNEGYGGALDQLAAHLGEQ